MKITPSPITAALAGLFAGTAMSLFWSRLADDTMLLIVAFLLCVALPAHAFVVGFGQAHASNTGKVETALLKRGGIWLVSAILAIGVTQALGI